MDDINILLQPYPTQNKTKTTTKIINKIRLHRTKPKERK